MRLSVHHIDRQRRASSISPRLLLPAFLKHAAVAGRGGGRSVSSTLRRAIGVALFYGDYLNKVGWLRLHGFRLPPNFISDPTELGDFSTLVGKAVADFLAKRLLNAKFTH